MNNTQPPRDSLIKRGTYHRSLSGMIVFTILRTADIYLQYLILARGLASPIFTSLPLWLEQSPDLPAAPPFIFDLSLRSSIILSFAIGSTLKQVYWNIFIQREEFNAQSAFIISSFNTIFNSFNSVLSLTSAVTLFLPPFLKTGDASEASGLLFVCVVTYVVGLLLEAGSETQRKMFKDDERNKGKAYTGGLFRLARHINYGGYVVWRACYALASGGWIWGSLNVTFLTYNFLAEAIPDLDEHCTKRYGATWIEYKKRVPYKLFPGIL